MDPLIRIGKILLFGFAGAVLFVVLLHAIVFVVVTRNWKSEYVTGHVIDETREYVKKTEGRWPKSWCDLGEGRDLSSYTCMNFGIDITNVTKQDVLSAITPKSGVYYIYPHARHDLESLYSELKSFQGRVSVAGSGH